MISRADVADLREGDVVEMRDDRWPDVVVRGALRANGDGALVLSSFAVIRYHDGVGALHGDWTLTVIERAPRPLYVNHGRTEPVPGDVVRDEDDPTTWCFFMSGTRHGTWMSNKAVFTASAYMPKRLRLLVDGETGQVVP